MRPGLGWGWDCGAATGPDVAAPGCDRAGNLGLTALPRRSPFRARSGTKLALGPTQTTTGTKLSSTRHVRSQPVQNSPHTAKNTHFSPFKASREKIIPVQTQTTDAGRIFSRSWSHILASLEPHHCFNETNDAFASTNKPALKPLTPLLPTISTTGETVGTPAGT